MYHKTFQHVFGLGDGCNVAASLSRTGLREMSGPFDWIICGMDDTLRLIKSHFEDFLNPEYLAPDPIPFNAGRRRHTKYESVKFVHDFAPEEDAPPLEDQIAEIQAKYQRRIDYFYRCIVEPTLFFHFEYEDHFEYWDAKYDEILAYLKTFHPENELVVMAYGDPAKSAERSYPYFYTQSQKDDHFLGYYVESNPELSALMHAPTLIPMEQRAKNLRFFIDKQLSSNREISMNEMRISRDKLKSEQEIWRGMVKCMQSGQTLSTRLQQDGVKKALIFGYTDFFEPTVDDLRLSGITVDCAMSWYLQDKQEVYGVPVYNPDDYFRQLEEQRKQQEQDNQENCAPSDEENFMKMLAGVPRFAEVDAVISVDVEDFGFVDEARKYFPCRVYTLEELVYRS